MRAESPGTGRRGEKGRSVADHIGAAIRSGRYVPGQRLVEAELTSDLGASRSTVREAFHRLSAEGLIEIVPNRGALVRRLSVTEALELFAIRCELEAFAARSAAANAADPRVRRRFERETTAIWSAAPRHSTPGYITENQRFHAALIAAGGNGQLVRLNRRLQLSLILAQIAAALTSEVIAASLREHRAIAGAVLDGDAAAAEAAIRDHLGRAMALLRAAPAHLFSREPDAAGVAKPG